MITMKRRDMEENIMHLHAIIIYRERREIFIYLSMQKEERLCMTSSKGL